MIPSQDGNEKNNRKKIKNPNRMQRKKIIVWTMIFWTIFSFSFLAISLSVQFFSGTWSYHLSDESQEGFNSVAISQDGNYIIASTYSDEVMLFNTLTRTPLWIYRDGFRTNKVDICANGSFMILSSQEGNLYLFNKSSPIPMWIYDAGVNRGVLNLKISSDASCIAASITNPEITLFFQHLNPSPVWNITGINMALSDSGN